MEQKSHKYVAIGAKISLGILLFVILMNCVTMYQLYKAGGDLPLWEIVAWATTQQYLLSIMLLVVTSVLAGILYFYKKYMAVIAAVILFFILIWIIN